MQLLAQFLCASVSQLARTDRSIAGAESDVASEMQVVRAVAHLGVQVVPDSPAEQLNGAGQKIRAPTPGIVSAPSTLGSVMTKTHMRIVFVSSDASLCGSLRRPTTSSLMAPPHAAHDAPAPGVDPLAPEDLCTTAGRRFPRVAGGGVVPFCAAG